jgi:Ricin-type beta-trefoil lectin domain
LKASIKTGLAALASTGLITAGLGLAAGSAQASTPLPAYPATTTLDLGSPYCVTDDVIMNDPLDSTSPIVDTAGNTGAGSPVVRSQATPPITYSLQYLDNTTNKWVAGPPPGTQLNPVTGEIAAYNFAGDAQYKGAPWVKAATAAGTNTYTVRDHGTDSLGAAGTEQFQLTVNDSGAGPSEVTTVSYKGNTFNNANGALTIQLNGGSATSTTLTLSAIASSLNIPNVGNVGSTPVTFALVGSPGWKLNGGSTGTVLTGTNASDPEIKATTPDGDVVFFTLSGISTTSGGVFYTNSDANPCVTGAPAPAPTPTPTGTPSPLPVSGAAGAISSFTDYSWSCLDNSNFNWAAGNPLQLWQCGAGGGADQQFQFATSGGQQVLQAIAPAGKPQGPWCVTDHGFRGRLTIEPCTGSVNQQVSKHGPYYVFGDGNVMDDAGFNARNGAAVIGYTQNGGRNQHWSLP